jgi:hypothetical protein
VEKTIVLPLELNKRQLSEAKAELRGFITVLQKKENLEKDVNLQGLEDAHNSSTLIAAFIYVLKEKALIIKDNNGKAEMALSDLVRQGASLVYGPNVKIDVKVKFISADFAEKGKKSVLDVPTDYDELCKLDDDERYELAIVIDAVGANGSLDMTSVSMPDVNCD